MVTYEAVEKFIDYVTYEDNDLLYGGLVEDAPESAVKAYDAYVKMVKDAEKQGLNL